MTALSRERGGPHIDEQEPRGGLLDDARFYQGKGFLRFLFQFLDGVVAEFLGDGGGHAGELVRLVSFLWNIHNSTFGETRHVRKKKKELTQMDTRDRPPCPTTGD